MWMFRGPDSSARERSGSTGPAHSSHRCRFIGALSARFARAARAGAANTGRIRGCRSGRKSDRRWRIEPRAVDRDHAHVPDRLASIIGAETITNARGRAVMTAFFSEELTAIRVTAKGFGQQDFSFVPGKLDAGAKVVELRPCRTAHRAPRRRSRDSAPSPAEGWELQPARRTAGASLHPHDLDR